MPSYQISLVKDDTIVDNEAALAAEGNDDSLDVNDEVVDDIEAKADDLVADAEDLKTDMEEVCITAFLNLFKLQPSVDEIYIAIITAEHRSLR